MDAATIPLLAGPAYCANGGGGCKTVTDADGVVRVPLPQCPFKPTRSEPVPEPQQPAWPAIEDAKALAYRLRKQGVMVLAVDASGGTGGATYGMTRKDCSAMGKFLDRVMELIESGDLPRPW